jgi:SAM-dependent methyltransferase
LETCTICGGTLATTDTIPGYKAPATFTVLDCPQCETMVASPTATDASVYEAIYSQPRSIPGYDRYQNFAEAIRGRRDPLGYLASREDAYWAVADSLHRIKARNVLEVGCGMGYLTYALSKAGYQARGIDISEAAVNTAKARYGDLYIPISVEAFIAESDMRFDAVVMTEVIEHLEHPFDIIAGVLRLLVPGGHLILTTPNRSFFATGERWATDLPPVHLWWFSESSLRQMAQRLGCSMELVDFTPYSLRYPLLYSHRSPLEPMLDETGHVVRTERGLIAFLRRRRLLHEIYWYLTAFMGALKLGGKNTNLARRPTLAAIFSP